MGCSTLPGGLLSRPSREWSVGGVGAHERTGRPLVHLGLAARVGRGAIVLLRFVKFGRHNVVDVLGSWGGRAVRAVNKATAGRFICAICPNQLRTTGR
jgi:hypothetical protein